MDILSEFLTKLRVDGSSIGTFAFGAPWGLAMAGGAFLYVVTEGSCLLLAPGEAPRELMAGDSVLSLRGAPVVLASAPDAPITTIQQLWRATRSPKTSSDGHGQPILLRWGGDGSPCRLFTLVATVPANAASQAILRTLPDVIVQKGGDTDLLTWLAQIDGFEAAESHAARPGFAALATALSRFVLVHLIRSFLLTSGAETAWMRAAAEPGIDRALRAIRTQPGTLWSIAALAREAGMSRSVFCAAFRRITGSAPMAFVRSQRMESAAMLLAEDRLSIAEIGARLGYGSERAFRTAFAETFALSPSAYHRARGARSSTS